LKASGPVPAVATKFTATAKSVGAWANNLTVGVAAGVITVYENGVAVETSPVQADVTAAQAWSAFSRYIDITPVGTGALTDTAPVALSGGADDRVNVTDTQRQAALDRFGRELGPGQVSMPGDARTQAYTMLATHARDRNRFAELDAPDTASVSAITPSASAVRVLGRELARHCRMSAPWLTCPGTTAGTVRTIPPSAVMSGMSARVDAAGNPNAAVAGNPRGVSRFALAPKYAFSDTDRSTLADAGVVVILARDNAVQAYDDVTLVDPNTDPEWLGAGANRLVMAIIAESLQIASAHMFNQVSGPVDLVAFGGDLSGALARRWQNRALYGATPDEAFRVETGAAVNTPATIQARQLKAALALKISPNARQVTVQITNTPLQRAL
jgi:hypothetical protein